MSICAKLGTASVRQITQLTLRSTARDYHTVYTTLQQMEKKGYVERLPGRKPQYRPVVAWSAVLREEIQIFLSEVIGPENLPLLEEQIRAFRRHHLPH
jgi:predicted transcriptional regulator